MIYSSLATHIGGRDNNEDYVRHAVYNTEECFILCDGLGGHDCGEVASMTAAEEVARLFEEKGDYPGFLDDAFNCAQNRLIDMQNKRNMPGTMKTTMVVLVVSDEQIKWAHIGDSRLYRIFDKGQKFERTKDHSVVQVMVDMGELKESDMRHSPDRNKLLRAMGSVWTSKSYDKSPILERDAGANRPMCFALMSDGFWEYVEDIEILEICRESKSCEAWLEDMTRLVEERADMTWTDNYSAICVWVE